MTVVSPEQAAILRQQPHYTRWNLSIYKPAEVLVGTLTQPLAYGARTVPFTYVSHSSGLYDFTNFTHLTCCIYQNDGVLVGRVRVKRVSWLQPLPMDPPVSCTITVAENNIKWAVAYRIVVIALCEPWAKWPRLVNNNHNIPTTYKDYDVAYSNQGWAFSPIPMMGPNLAGDMEVISGQASFYFDGSKSYCMGEGSSSLTYSWYFQGADTETSTNATPGFITWSSAGHYMVALRVTCTYTGSITKTTIAYRHVSVYDPTRPELGPITNWGVQSLTGSYDSSSWSGKAWFRQEVNETVVVDNAVAIVYAADTRYGSTSVSLGGNYPNRENIVFCGYIGNGSIDIDQVTSVVQFDLVSLVNRLQTMECPACSIKSIPTQATVPTWKSNHKYDLGTDDNVEIFVKPTSPNGHVYLCWGTGNSGGTQPVWTTSAGIVDDNETQWKDCYGWDYFTKLTVDIAIYAYAYWNSTIYQVADLNRLGNSSGIANQDFGKTNLFSCLETLTQSARLAHICVDRQGQLWIETKADYMPLTQRSLDTAMAIDKRDWREKLGIKLQRVRPSSYIELDGVAYTNTTGAAVPMIASAPSNLPDYIGSAQNMNGIAFDNQTNTNEFAGCVYADKVKPYPSVHVPLSGFYSVFDTVPQQKVLLTVSGSENYAGISWSNKEFIARTVSLTYSSESFNCQVDMDVEEYSWGRPGQAGPYPPKTPTSTTPPSPAPVPVPDSAYRVVAATKTKVAYTDNYSEGSTWTKTARGVNGDIFDLELDKWDHNNQLWIASSTGIWRVKNYRNIEQDCVNVLSLDVFRTVTGTSKSFSRLRVCVTITANDVVYAHIVCTDGSVYIGYSNDDGDSWGINYLTMSTANVEHGFAVSQHDYMKLLASGGNGKLWYSSDSGGTWSNVHSVAGATKPIANIEWPYADNATDQIVWIGGI